jgi:hypothetical protein
MTRGGLGEEGVYYRRQKTKYIRSVPLVGLELIPTTAKKRGILYFIFFHDCDYYEDNMWNELRKGTADFSKMDTVYRYYCKNSKRNQYVHEDKA